MRMRYESVKEDPHFLFGVNADICAWISEGTRKESEYNGLVSVSLFREYPETRIRTTSDEETPKTILQQSEHLTKDDYVLALGKRNPFERRQKCIDIIKKLWASYPGLGPYPLLDELIEFENHQVFYSKYRDHSAHQLMNYLLGLYIYSHCKPIREKTTEEIKASLPALNNEELEKEFILRWFVASIVHDVGYVIEDSKADPAKDPRGEDAELWKLVETQINGILLNCLTKTPVFSAKDLADDRLINEQLQGNISLGFKLPKSINRPETIGLVDSEDWLKKIDSALKTSGIVDNEEPLRTYYKLAHENTPQGQDRQGFWDHGITSALILLRVWYAYREKIHAVVKHNNLLQMGLTHCKEVFDNLATLERGDIIDHELCDEKTIVAAAEAISLHNINKDIWGTHCKAFEDKSFRISNYLICLTKEDTTHSPKPLAFLLALVDTLQDWHRPSFKLHIDQARSTALIDKDLSITFSNGANSENILLYYRDENEYRKVEDRLLAFLDKKAIQELMVRNPHGNNLFMVDTSFSCYVPPFESYERNGAYEFPETDGMGLGDDYTLEECLLEEDADKIQTWAETDPRRALLERDDIRMCPKSKKPCKLRMAPLVTLAELGQCSLALQDTMLVYNLLRELKSEILETVQPLLGNCRFQRCFADPVRRLRFALINIPESLDRKLRLKSIYNPVDIKGFLRCRVETEEAERFCAAYDNIQRIAKSYQDPLQLFKQLKAHDNQLDLLDRSLSTILVRLGDIIKNRTDKTELKIRENIKEIHGIAPLEKLYKNINKSLPHNNVEKEKIW